MDFTLFNVSGITDDEVLKHPEENGLDSVEMGLSPGELRQSILDRTKSDLESEFHSINKNLTQFGLSIKEELLADETNIDAVMDDLDNFLYDVLEDEDLNETRWSFKKSDILVIGTE